MSDRRELAEWGLLKIPNRCLVVGLFGWYILDIATLNESLNGRETKRTQSAMSIKLFRVGKNYSIV